MRKVISGGIRITAFLLVLVMSLCGINYILRNKYIYSNNTYPTTSTYRQFYLMEENTVDVLFLGSSVAQTVFIPQELYNEYGIRSYNLSSVSQSPFISYYWLKEALRFQSPKAVVMDTMYMFTQVRDNEINMPEGLIRKALDPMKWSAVKREAVRAVCEADKSQSELSYYLTNFRFHGRWAELREVDFMTAETSRNELKGFAPLTNYGPSAYAAYSFGGNADITEPVPELIGEYMEKIAELCREQGIELILLSIPGSKMSDSRSNTLNAFAAEHNIDYYNLCEAETYNSLGLELPRENAINHGNIWGARKVSLFFGKLLSEKYGVPSVYDEQYESTREFYSSIFKNGELSHIDDICEYLDAVNDSRYTLFITVSDDASRGMSPETVQKLYALGLTADLSDKYAWSFSAVISPENGVAQKLAQNEACILNGSFRGGRTFYSLCSGGVYSAVKSSITINGEEYGINSSGINIVVYDNTLMKVIDSVAFNLSAATAAR